MIKTGEVDIFIIFKKVALLIEWIYLTYLKNFIEPLLPTIEIIFNILTVIFIVGIIVVLIKFRKLRIKEREFYKPEEIEKSEASNNKIQWSVVLDHISSNNSAEWKIAIIEADNILDNILKEAGYEGETLADRLKSAGNSESVQKAWEAHKVRNEIAHEGGKEITQHEAKRVISLYENVFKRFGYL